MRRPTSVITIGLLLATAATAGAQSSMSVRGESGRRGSDRDCATCEVIVAGAGAVQHAALAFLLMDWQSGAPGKSGKSLAWSGWSSEAGASGGSVVFAEAPARSRGTPPGFTLAASRAADGWRGGWSHARSANDGWPFGHALGLRGQGLTEGGSGGTSGLLAPTVGGTTGGTGGSISAPPLEATAAPEPATMALVATGLAGLAAARRKRSKR